ncbi:hypothetical protein N566_06145 [Streptomycetaceae bacterium MP113-05]|nr:hypothetical protein N566_06145 [Streptomycetaceae bacterium MP113-05]
MPRPSPRRRSIVAGLFAALATTACTQGAGETGPTGGGPGTSGPAPATGATPTTAPRMPAELLLDWLVTGGYAGVHSRTLLHDDGTFTVTPRGAPTRGERLRARDMTQVRALLAEARLGSQPERGIDPHLRDGFHYRIAHAGHVVHRDDTTLGVPLRRLRDLLPHP